MNDIPRKVIIPKNVTDALRTVIFPDSNKDIVTLEMVQEIRVAGKSVNFSLVFQRSDDPNIDSDRKSVVEGKSVDLGGRRLI